MRTSGVEFLRYQIPEPPAPFDMRLAITVRVNDRIENTNPIAVAKAYCPCINPNRNTKMSVTFAILRVAALIRLNI